MPIYELTHDAIVPISKVSLASQGIKERQDLQRILKAHIHAISPDTLVLAEEYHDWEDSRRSIDLLCLDKEANLVVIELKRTDDGGHMELQAIRYAAMVSKMTFSDAVNAHSDFLKENGGNADDAEAAILRFLGWDEPIEHEFVQDIRIVLVSGDFNKEITTSVLWLNERDLDIRCVRLRPYKLGEKTLLDIEQVLPLQQAREYQIQLRKKAAEEREAHERRSDWSKYDLRIDEKLYPGLSKRQLFLLAVRALVDHGISVNKLQQVILPRKFLGLPGKLTADEFCSQASLIKTKNGALYDFRRFYVAEGDLFFSEGMTWALSNQWSIKWLPQLDELISKYPEAQISYTRVSEPSGD